MCLAQLVAFQVHPGERDQCRGVGVLGRRLLLAGMGRRRLSGQLRSVAQLAAQGLHQREMPKTMGSFALPAGAGCGAHRQIKDMGCLIETARP